MPRIDPTKLLTCLSVLLSPNGGIRSADEVQRLADLMVKYSKKLVSKCIYIQILKSTDTELLGKFMSSGGWALTHVWFTDGILTKNWPLVQEILELLLLCPVDVHRLKSNSSPKLVKGLSKDGGNEGVRILATKLVEQWLKIVKGEQASNTIPNKKIIVKNVYEGNVQQQPQAPQPQSQPQPQPQPQQIKYHQQSPVKPMIMVNTDKDVQEPESPTVTNENINATENGNDDEHLEEDHLDDDAVDDDDEQVEEGNVTEETEKPDEYEQSNQKIEKEKSTITKPPKKLDTLVYKLTIKDGKQYLAKVENPTKQESNVKQFTFRKVQNEITMINNDFDKLIKSPSSSTNSLNNKKSSTTTTTAAANITNSKRRDSSSPIPNSITHSKASPISKRRMTTDAGKYLKQSKENVKIGGHESDNDNHNDRKRESSSPLTTNPPLSSSSSSTQHRSSSKLPTKPSSSSGSSKSKTSSSSSSNIVASGSGNLSSSSSSSYSKSSSKDKYRDKERDKTKDSNRDKDKHRSSSSSSKSSHSHSSNSHSHSSSSSSNNNNNNNSSNKVKSKVEEKLSQIQKDRETLSKISSASSSSSSLSKLGKIPKKPSDKDNADTKSNSPIAASKKSISIEVRKDNDKRPKTAKTFHSQFRNHGLAEEAPPPPSRRGLVKPNNTTTSGSIDSNTTSISLKRSISPTTLTIATSASAKDGLPGEKRIKLDSPTNLMLEKSIKLIPAKPKPSVLVESDMFMDAISAATPKIDINRLKRKRIPSTTTNSTSTTATQSSSTSSSDTSSTTTTTTTTTTTSANDDKKLMNTMPMKFYQDTLSEDGNKKENKKENDKDDDANADDDDENKNSSSENRNADNNNDIDLNGDNQDNDEPTKKHRLKSLIRDDSIESDNNIGGATDPKHSTENGIEAEAEEETEEKEPGPGCGPNGPPGVLMLHPRKGPKKQLKWKDALEEIRYFESDENERINVTKTFIDMSHMERCNEREGFMLSRKLNSEDIMVEQMPWAPLRLIDGVPVTPNGENSLEREVQAKRESTVLRALYFDSKSVPPSPGEPDFEHHPIVEPIIIPWEDISGIPGSKIDFTSAPWPVPRKKGGSTAENNFPFDESSLLSNSPDFLQLPTKMNPPVGIGGGGGGGGIVGGGVGDIPSELPLHLILPDLTPRMQFIYTQQQQQQHQQQQQQQHQLQQPPQMMQMQHQRPPQLWSSVKLPMPMNNNNNNNNNANIHGLPLSMNVPPLSMNVPPPPFISQNNGSDGPMGNGIRGGWRGGGGGGNGNGNGNRGFNNYNNHNNNNNNNMNMNDGNWNRYNNNNNNNNNWRGGGGGGGGPNNRFNNNKNNNNINDRYRKRPCKAFQKGFCRLDDKCTFLHILN